MSSHFLVPKTPAMATMLLQGVLQGQAPAMKLCQSIVVLYNWTMSPFALAAVNCHHLQAGLR